MSSASNRNPKRHRSQNIKPNRNEISTFLIFSQHKNHVRTVDGLIKPNTVQDLFNFFQGYLILILTLDSRSQLLEEQVNYIQAHISNSCGSDKRTRTKVNWNKVTKRFGSLKTEVSNLVICPKSMPH